MFWAGIRKKSHPQKKVFIQKTIFAHTINSLLNFINREHESD